MLNADITSFVVCGGVPEQNEVFRVTVLEQNEVFCTLTVELDIRIHLKLATKLLSLAR